MKIAANDPRWKVADGHEVSMQAWDLIQEIQEFQKDVKGADDEAEVQFGGLPPKAQHLFREVMVLLDQVIPKLEALKTESRRQ